MTMTPGRQMQPRQPQAVRKFGDLPPSTTGMDAERALELAGVDATELALAAWTTFKEARTLEELVTMVSTTRRRGLDTLTRQVYYERFGGQSSDPSLHVGIDGLRAIAAATGRFGGRLEPHFSGVWQMPLEGGKSKPVPEKCVITVYSLVQGHKCAFEGVAWMEESYPGPTGRGRTWRERPRGMLSIAAERQALRAAFPTETSGIADAPVDIGVEDEPWRAERTQAENVEVYERIHKLDEWGPTTTGSSGATVEVRTGEVLKEPERQVKVGDLEANRLAELVEQAAKADVEFDDLKVSLPAPYERVIRAIGHLQDRVEQKRRQSADAETDEQLPL